MNHSYNLWEIVLASLKMVVVIYMDASLKFQNGMLSRKYCAQSIQPKKSSLPASSGHKNIEVNEQAGQATKVASISSTIYPTITMKSAQNQSIKIPGWKQVGNWIGNGQRKCKRPVKYELILWLQYWTQAIWSLATTKARDMDHAITHKLLSSQRICMYIGLISGKPSNVSAA